MNDQPTSPGRSEPSAAADWLPLVGQTLGHYRVVSMLGKGGMGQVFLAEDLRLRRQVALKMVQASSRSDADAFDRLMREARAASALNHPHIITIYDIGDAPSGRFIAMEYVHGRTLRDYIAERPSIDAAIGYVQQAARALAAAHAAGIVHRDIKPENVMVRDDGYVKVLDFGLAHMVAAVDPADATHSMLTLGSAGSVSGGAVAGTLRYMSPEQVTAGTLTSATDIFSLGLALYELLTGRHPFGSDTGLAHVVALSSLVPVAPSRHAPDIPEALDDLVNRMLSHDPAGRPAAEQVAAELMAIAQPAHVAPRRLPSRISVGRDQELRALEGALAGVRAGRGHLAIVSGEAGLGKTTLVEEFLRRAGAGSARVTVGRGRCSERLAGAGAYLAMLEAVQALAAGHPTAGKALRAVASSWYSQLSATSQGQAHAAPPAPDRMKRELAAMMQEVARNTTPVLFLDDLHWADAATLDALAYLLDRADVTPLLAIGTCRPSEVSRVFSDLRLEMAARGLVTDIPLGPLAPEEVARYVAVVFAHHAFPPGFNELVHRRTEGHPLFMADLLRYLRERGIVAQQNGIWTVAESLETVERAVPESVQSMVSRKLDQLTDEERRLLVAASVQGDEFDVVVVAAVLEEEAHEIEESLEPLERVRCVVRLVGEKELPDGTLTARYRFVHALYQDALYASLRPARRAALSRAVANALMRFHAPRPERVAAHVALLFEAARDMALAAEHFLTAARLAARLGAHREAVSLARRGLSALERVPEDDARRRLELDLHLALVVPLSADRTHGAAEVVSVFERARGLCEQLGADMQLFGVLVGLTWSKLGAGQTAAARADAEQCMQLADRLGDAGLQLEAHLLLGEAHSRLGAMALACRHFRQTLELYDPSRHAHLADLFGSDPAIHARADLAYSSHHLGRFREARALAAEAADLARRLKHPTTTALALVLGTSVHLVAGRHAAGAAMLAELKRLLEQYPSAHVLWLPFLEAWADFVSGRCEADIVTRMEMTTAALRAAGNLYSVPSIQTHVAEVSLQLGDIERALAVADQAYAEAEAIGERYVLGELLRLRAEALFRRADARPDSDPSHAAAERAYVEAIEFSNGQGLGLWRLRASIGLARLLIARGRAEEARACVLPIAREFDGETEDVTDICELRRLAAQLGAV